MNQTEKEALKNVVNYLYEAEKKDYEYSPKEAKENHIFNDLLILNEFINEVVDL